LQGLVTRLFLACTRTGGSDCIIAGLEVNDEILDVTFDTA